MLLLCQTRSENSENWHPAIKRMKVFHILQHELPINLLPLVDDIVISICALTNILLQFYIIVVWMFVPFRKHFSDFQYVICLTFLLTLNSSMLNYQGWRGGGEGATNEVFVNLKNGFHI